MFKSFKKESFRLLFESFNSLIVPKSSNESENEFNAEKKQDKIIRLSIYEFLILVELQRLLDNSGNPSLIMRTSQIINLRILYRFFLKILLLLLSD